MDGAAPAPRAEVVEEVDVYLGELTGCDPGTSDPQASGASSAARGGREDETATYRRVVMSQYPLRPDDRPYPVAGGSAEGEIRMRCKPVNERIELDMPIEGRRSGGSHGFARQKPASQMSHMTFRSSEIDLPTNYMVGMETEAGIVLLPLDRAFQFRPKFSYLDAAEDEVSGKTPLRTAHGSRAEGSSRDGERAAQENGLELLTVQIQRHETQRQIEARQNSHAFLKQKEDREEWVDLHVNALESEESQSLRDAWAQAPAHATGGAVHAVSGSLHRERNIEYFKKIVPHFSTAATDLNGASTSDAAGGSEGHRSSLSEAAASTFAQILEDLFEQESVCSLGKVHQFCIEAKKANSEGQSEDAFAEVIGMSREQLHAEIVATGKILFVCSRYCLKLSGSPSIDLLRGVVLRLFEAGRAAVKKTDVFDAALEVSIDQASCAQMFNMVMKDLCVKKGSAWILKQGD